MHFTCATLARRYYLSSCVCLSVRLSITSRCSTETAKRRTTQTTPHDSPRTIVLWFHSENLGKTQTGSPTNGCAKCRCGSCKRRLSTRRVVNLARSQVYHTERPPYSFAARSPWCSASRGVYQGQLIVVIYWFVQFLSSWVFIVEFVATRTPRPNRFSLCICRQSMHVCRCCCLVACILTCANDFDLICTY